MRHASNLKNKLGKTVAMLVANINDDDNACVDLCTLDRRWWHDPYIHDINGHTVAMLYLTNMNSDYCVSDASSDVTPNEARNINKNKFIDVPVHWRHDPSI